MSLKEGLGEGWTKVEHWLSRLSPNTYKTNLRTFKLWMKWVRQSDTKFAESTPDDLIEYQREVDNGSRFDILDIIVQPFINQKRGRIGYKVKLYTTARSFFAHNRAELPKDPGFNLRPEVEKVRGTLTVEEVRKIVLSCKPAYQAMFLSMLQGAMGLEEITYWNQNGWESLKQQLDDNVHPIKVDLPGRKKARNVRSYHTYIGGDAIEALRNYVDNHRPEDSKVIFPNRFGRAISKNALYLYWLRHLRKLGLVPPPVKGEKSHRTGKNPHELRDVFRSQWEKSPAKGSIAEFLMGHNIDPLEYNKAYRDETWTRKEYLKAEPLLNIISSDRPFGKVDESEIERQEGRIAELERLLEEERTINSSRLVDLERRFMDRIEAMEQRQREHFDKDK